MINFGGGMIFPDSYAAPQYTPAEEARQDAYERALELAEEFSLADLEPDFDPYTEEAA